MRSFLLFLAICLMSPLLARAQNSVPPQNPQPLNEEQKRLVLLQLYELEAARAKIAQYEDWIKREQALYEREKAVNQQLLDNEKARTTIAEKERDLAKDQAEFYKNLYETVTKSRGCGFFGSLGRIFTLGAYRCK